MPPPATPSYRAGVLWMLLSGASFGCVAILGKLAFAMGWTVPSLLAVRWTVGAIALAGLLVLMREPVMPPRRAWPRVIALGLLGLGATSGLFFLGLHAGVDAGVASVLLFTNPAIVALLSLFLGERLGLLGGVALLLSMGGAWLVTTGGVAGSAPLPGVLLCLGAAFTYSLYMVAGRRLSDEVPGGALAVGVMASSAVGFTLAALLVPGGAGTGGGWLGLAYAVGLGVIGSAVSIGAFFRGLPAVGASRAAILSTTEPLATIVFAALFLAELPSALQLLGAAGILGAVVLLAQRAPTHVALPDAAPPTPVRRE